MVQKENARRKLAGEGEEEDGEGVRRGKRQRGGICNAEYRSNELVGADPSHEQFRRKEEKE